MGVGAKQGGVAEMKGEWLLQAVARYRYDVAINPACGGDSLHLAHKTVRMLADGSILARYRRYPWLK